MLVIKEEPYSLRYRVSAVRISTPKNRVAIFFTAPLRLCELIGIVLGYCLTGLQHSFYRPTPVPSLRVRRGGTGCRVDLQKQVQSIEKLFFIRKIKFPTEVAPAPARRGGPGRGQSDLKLCHPLNCSPNTFFLTPRASLSPR